MAGIETNISVSGWNCPKSNYNNWPNDEVEQRAEERDEAGWKLTADFDTKIKKLCERDKWVIY